MAKPQFAMVVSVGIVVSTLLGARSAAAQWRPMGGNLAGWAPPAVASRMVSGVQTISVYGLDANSTNVWVNEINASTNTPTGWNTNLGGTVISRPTAVGWTNYRDVFVLSTDWQIWHNKSTDNVNWSGWQQLHAPTHANGLCSNPSAVSWAQNRIDVFALGCDEHLYELTWAGSSWNWADRGCCFASDPSATSAGNGKLNISIIDVNGNLTIFTYNGSWSTARPLGGVTDPAGGWWNLPNGSFASVGFALDSTSTMWGTDNQSGSWTARSTGMVPTRPRVALEDTFVDVYFLDQTSKIARFAYDGSWSGASLGLWQSGVTFVSDPTVLALNGTASMRDIYVFAIKADGTLWFARDPAM